MRVYELAQDLNLSTPDLLQRVRELYPEIKNGFASLNDEQEEAMRGIAAANDPEAATVSPQSDIASEPSLFTISDVPDLLDPPIFAGPGQSNEVSRKERFVCNRYPSYSIALGRKLIQFERGSYTTDDQGEIEAIRADPYFNLFIIPDNPTWRVRRR